jgi:hypothetical protein
VPVLPVSLKHTSGKWKHVIFATLFVLMLFADIGERHAVLPAFIFGLAMSRPPDTLFVDPATWLFGGREERAEKRHPLAPLVSYTQLGLIIPIQPPGEPETIAH